MANTCTTEICQKVIALMKEGMTQQEVCAEIGIGARTIRDWKDKRSPQYEKEFDEAYQEGKMYQEAWWLKAGRANLGCGKNFNTSLFGLYMANLFGWRSGASRGGPNHRDSRISGTSALL
jgi:hypothetical protein